MLRNRNIAFFIDVDNVDLTSENYDNILAQLEGMGTILTGKVYGAKERKHKTIYQNAEVKGYKVERPMRIKRRGRRDFDSRIFVDVVDAVCKAPAIDAVCVITASCDLVYLYSYLHGKGIKVISSEENEQASSELVDEMVDLGRVYELKLPVSKPRAVTSKPKAKSTVTKTASSRTAKPAARYAEENDGNTDELLREIARLRNITETQQAEKEARKKAEQEARERAEAEAKAREEEQRKAREKVIEEVRIKAYEDARKEAEREAQAKAKAEEEARRKAEQEAKSAAEKEARKKALEEAKAKAEAEAKTREEEQRKSREKAIEEARIKAYEEARKEAEKEAQAKVKAEEEAKKKAIEEAERIRAEAEARQKAYEEAKAREEALNKKIAELEALQKEEEQAKNVENAEELMREIEKLKRLTGETNQLVKELKETPREQVILQYGVADSQKEESQAVAVDSVAEQKTAGGEEQPQNVSQYSHRSYYIPQTDSNLIRKIEEIRKGNGDSETDDLLEEIRKLLDGLD